MIAHIGRIHMIEKSTFVVNCGFKNETKCAGFMLIALGVVVKYFSAYSTSTMDAFVYGLFLCGLVVFTLRRVYKFDKSEGYLFTTEQCLGLGFKKKIPLFHIRSVIVEPSSSGGLKGPFILRLEMRRGLDIVIDEALAPKRLLVMADAISELIGSRFEYDTGAFRKRHRPL